MDVSELRKRILRAIDEARRDASDRRTVVDEASRAYARFLSAVAVPLLHQSAQVLNATTAGSFSVHTPEGGARLASDRAAETFLEFQLDTTGERPAVLGRVSLSRGRAGQLVEERPVAPDKSIDDVTEDDVTAFLVAEIPRLVVKP
jgi:hypothetical protein